jgi:hypothetical protein
MATWHARKSQSLAVKSMELAVSTPQVIAHRLARLSLDAKIRLR